MLNQAIYVAAQDKIYGTMGPYIAKFNATTGEREAISKVTAPAEGPCHLVYHAGTVYVSCWNAQVGASSDGTTVTSLYRDIFPVNPTTLAVGARLGVYDAMQFAIPSYMMFEGPHQMISLGSMLWFDWQASGATHQYVRIDPSAPGTWTPFISNSDKFVADLRFCVGQFATDGTNIIYANAQNARLAYFNAVGVMATAAACNLTVGDTGVVMPVAVEYCPADTKTYAVCASEYVMRVDAWSGTNYTKFNLSALVTSGCNPFHIRYRSSNQCLYLPSQGNDTVLVWNPVTDPAMGSVLQKTGFDGPIDVVFTGSKAFAVQSGVQSLKEIV